MARVPTWTELRLDATKLAQLQKECYRSVHNLLDRAIPELDRKLSTLNGSRIKAQRSTSYDLRGLEHLKPLPMPLSEYLKRNRPDMVSRADQRVMYLRKKAERRKQNQKEKRKAAFKEINSFSRMKISNSCVGFNQRPFLRSSSRSSSRDIAHDYHVKSKLSEQEMKRLTARTYKRLPEVKRQRNDEATKHMKIQNYKNKLEYGRKLLENRRHGIINYPLRSNCDDSSIISSQEDSLLSSCGQSADAYKMEAYY